MHIFKKNVRRVNILFIILPHYNVGDLLNHHVLLWIILEVPVYHTNWAAQYNDYLYPKPKL